MVTALFALLVDLDLRSICDAHTLWRYPGSNATIQSRTRNGNYVFGNVSITEGIIIISLEVNSTAISTYHSQKL